ncbi:SLAC1 anion channel family protein [Cohaesibacter celericrescens]|uniref:C4-dicarboxylate ABC transporter n=1 Tax=Cohaesibacter celericrescens TaxID=2067669 RepID=A0A2N5XR77_9HYPH|nr:SLAC1 anion channel family protein [Cohaesibacter celericrescens]PLW77026.1 C4-dicarboxylate ABC transporter [Cohaesibacter celericrescens]
MTHPDDGKSQETDNPSATTPSGAEDTQQNEKPSRLEHFPNSFFAMIMGLAGFTLAAERLEKSLGWAHQTSLFLLVITFTIFAVLLGLYALKAVRYPAMVIWEWNHPVRINFFPAASIGLILMGTALGPFSETLSLIVWGLGAALHIIATLAVLSTWIGHRIFESPQLNPAWFIPVVGNIIVPITASRFGFVELGWFFFSVGLVFWMVLLTLVFNRLVFHNPLPARLLPTLMILIAPPAIGFVAYVSMTGTLDTFARILFNIGAFFFLIILMQVPKLAKISFTLSWWAYSFPLAALTISTLLFAEKAQSDLHLIAGIGLFGLLILVIAGLLLRTAKAIANQQICKPE